MVLWFWGWCSIAFTVGFVLGVLIKDSKVRSNFAALKSKHPLQSIQRTNVEDLV
jgi:hypothetical protein